jgi:hypothetical protein
MFQLLSALTTVKKKGSRSTGRPSLVTPFGEFWLKNYCSLVRAEALLINNVLGSFLELAFMNGK